jgi:leader peptidase (prepilin peptidase)/N-methyltransferase
VLNDILEAFLMSLPVLPAALVFLFGAVVGSFLNVCICRLPQGESVVTPRSRCPRCLTGIAWYDNIPVLSWLVLKGKCRSCGLPISWQYPLVELLNGLLTLFLFIRFGISPAFPVLFLFSSALVVVTFIDLEHQIIPDVISIPGIVIGFLASFLAPGSFWVSSLIGILAGGGSLLLVAYGYQWLTGKEGMGGGDVKLLAMMGAFLGWRAVPFIIFTGSLLGATIGIAMMVVRGRDSRLAIPFGPFLAFGAILYIFYGSSIIAWYLGLGVRAGG